MVNVALKAACGVSADKEKSLNPELRAIWKLLRKVIEHLNKSTNMKVRSCKVNVRSYIDALQLTLYL